MTYFDSIRVRSIITLLSVSIYLYLSAFSKFHRFEKLERYYLKETPPNCIKISDNFFCDMTECANVHWREYVFWNMDVFGDSSIQVLEALPDTLVWRKNPNYGEPMFVQLYRFPAYDLYPIVGVTQEQAKAFSKWRSDRVFEMYLIKYGVIEFDEHPTPETYFTIERYFKGEINRVNKQVNIKFYPHYRLPTVAESEMLVARFDSLNQAHFKDYEETCGAYYTKFQKGPQDPPILHVYSGCAPKQKKTIYNIRGNVSEWNDEENFATGGSYMDNEFRIQITDTILDLKNAYVGFRNVFEWKEWKDE